MEITNRQVIRILAVTSVFFGAGWLLYLARRPVIWILSAFILAVALNPLVDFITARLPGKKKRRNLAVGLVYVSFIVLTAWALANLVPLLVTQTQNLVQALPGYIQRLQDADNILGELIRRYEVVDKIKNSGTLLVQNLGQAREPIVGFVKGLLGGLVAVITVLFLTYFMLLEGPKWFEAWWEIHPPAKRRHRRQLADQFYRIVSGYVLGQLLTSLLAGLAAGIMMAIIGLPFALPLAILVAILDLLPLIGATLAALAVVGFAAFSSLSDAAIMLIFFVVYQQLENHLFVPLVYSRTVKVSPLTVLIAALLGATLAGLFGALIAIPLASMLRVLIKDYYSVHAKS